MDKSTLFNIIKFIGTKVPEYELLTNEKGWYKLPKQGWRDENGKKQGYWENYNNDGGLILLLQTEPNLYIISKGNYVDDKKEGKWIYYYNNGIKKWEGNYVNGKEDGKWIYYKPDGNKSRGGNYINGKPIGKWIYFDEDGSVRNIEYYG